MKLLVNDKEISAFLNSMLTYSTLVKRKKINYKNANKIFLWALKRKGKKGQIVEKFADKIWNKILLAVKKDVLVWRDSCLKIHNKKQKFFTNNLHKNLDYIFEKIDEKLIFSEYKKSKNQNFIKTVGIQLDQNAELVRRKNFTELEEDCLLRNTVGNEQLLIEKIKNKYPFWFIDSGYTNFLEGNKKWHRLVRNHLHYSTYFTSPADRLQIFPSFPNPWRNSGDIILVIEPGIFASSIFNIDLKTWRASLEKEIRLYTDKKIIFRPKQDKKIRSNLYQELLDEDYYCTISLNSNSSIESIWAGVPAITLGKHISNPVTVNRLSSINDLYKGELGNWLCWLSYNQFTFDELMNGNAIDIVKKYHE